MTAAAYSSLATVQCIFHRYVAVAVCISDCRACYFIQFVKRPPAVIDQIIRIITDVEVGQHTLIESIAVARRIIVEAESTVERDLPAVEIIKLDN